MGVPVRPGVTRADVDFDSLMTMLRPQPTGKSSLLLPSGRFHSPNRLSLQGATFCKDLGCDWQCCVARLPLPCEARVAEA